MFNYRVLFRSNGVPLYYSIMPPDPVSAFYTLAPPITEAFRCRLGTNYVPWSVSLTGPAVNQFVSDTWFYGTNTFANTVTFQGAASFEQVPAGTFTNSWRDVQNKPLQYVAVPGQQRPSKARVGWNSWFDMHLSPTGAAISNVANQFIHWGLRDAGWIWLGIDDGWHEANRDGTSHRLIPKPSYYPQGMRAFVDGLHSMGFKVGLYLSSRYAGDPAAPATGGYPRQDAETFCEWDIDLIKFDGVGSASWLATFYDVEATLCLSNNRAPLWIETYCTPTDGFGVSQDPRLKLLADGQLASRDWGDSVLYWLDRLGNEIAANHTYWSTFVPNTGVLVASNSYYSLAINYGNGMKSQMSLVSMLSGSLICQRFQSYASNALSPPPPEVLTAMLNTNVIAIQQDPAQVTGWNVFDNDVVRAYVKPLDSFDGPEWAVLVWNRSGTQSNTFHFGLTNLPVPFAGPWRAVELWSGTTQMVSSVISTTNEPFEPKLFRLTPYWRLRQ